MSNTSFATLFFALAICCLTILNSIILEAQTLRNLFFNSNENVVQLDFSTEPPTVVGTGTQGSLEGIVHYEDDNGNLLFWFNTDASANGGIYNQNGDKMLGSEGILANDSAAEICVAPSPNNSSQYYLIYNAANCTNLYYSIIDMSLDNGLGDVVALNTVISNNNFAEGIEVIAIPQTADYWLVAYQCNVGFTRFLIDENGVDSGTVFYNFATPTGYDGRGELDYHKGYFGSAFSGSNIVVLGSFDPITGNSCNETVLTGTNGNLGVSFNTKPYGIEFSPSANKMYISLWQTNFIDIIFQYDIETATIAGFAPTLDLDNIINDNVTVGQIELGRDGRLYIIEQGGTNILSIDNPDDDTPNFNLIPVPATTNLGITDHIQSHIFQDETYLGETICLAIGESATLTPQNTETQYSWANINDTNTELAVANTFDVVASAEVQQFVAVPVDGCTNELEYVVYPTPSDISAGPDQNIALGQGVVLSASTSILVESVLWFPIDGLDDPTSLTPTASPSETTTYTLSLQNGPCQAQDQITVFVFEDGVINETNCVIFGQTYNLTMPDTLLNPTWVLQDDPSIVLSNSHDFTVTIGNEILTYVGNGDNPNAPNGVLSQITLIPQPNLNAGSDMVITAGETIELNATGGGSSGYAWTENTTLSDTNINNPMATPSETTTYYVTSNYGDSQCQVIDSITLIVINTQDAVQEEICAIVGETISLQVGEGDFAEISWRNADDPTTTIATGESYEVVGESTTKAYFASAQDAFGNITVFYFTIYPNPTITVGNDLTILEGESITLNAEGGDNYSWQPADLLFDADTATPTTNITETTLFTVTNTTENNCNFSKEITITVKSESFTLIPSGFSPNNDGVNDVLNILPFNVSELITFEIYDRWGKMIYQTNDMTAGWNGEIKNRAADMGVYVYFVSLIAKDGTPYTQKGNVTLIR